jgi:hypothetical protein
VGYDRIGFLQVLMPLPDDAAARTMRMEISFIKEPEQSFGIMFSISGSHVGMDVPEQDSVNGHPAEYVANESGLQSLSWDLRGRTFIVQAGQMPDATGRTCQDR